MARQARSSAQERHAADREAATLSKVAAGPPVAERLQADFQEFGLSGHQARILLALLQLGTAGASQLAQSCSLSRTSVYPVLEALTRKRLVQPKPGGLWSTVGRARVLPRLYATQEERLRELRTRMEQAEELLDLIPEDEPTVLPYVHVLHGAGEGKAAYERLVGSARAEILMFTRPPFTWRPGDANPIVTEAVSRTRLSVRVLYEAPHLEAPDSAAFREELKTYHEAGVQARVVKKLPIKLAIFDRSDVLLLLTDPVNPEVGYPTTQLIEHPGFAAIQAAAFEYLWATARPCPIASAGNRRKR